MRLHRPVIVLATLLLAACKPPAPADAPAATPAPETAPVATEAPVIAPPAATAPTADAATWRAIGTEPFWGVQVLGGNLVFTTPEDQQGQVLPATMRKEGEATVYSGGEAGRAYSLTLTPGECSDGMSDRVFGHKAEFVLGEARYAGCAAAKGEAWGE